MQNTSFVVIDENGQNVTNGFGWLYAGGPQRICTINDCSPLDSLHNTGDWVKVDELGQIFYLHRKDDQIKRLGKRLNLQEIDCIILKELSFIDNCKAVLSDGRLILFYKSSEEEKLINKTFLEETIKQTLKKFLPSYYQPDYLVKVDSFPLNHHGKQNIPSLLEMLKENMVKHHSLEEIFMESWKISLNLPEDTFIDPSTNFVYGGGNSLMAIHFIDQLELNLGIKLTPLIHSVFYSSCAETLSRLKELVYKHEQKNSIHNKEDIKSEITKKELFLNSDVSVMEDYNEKLNDDLVKKPKIHLSNNETLSSSRSFIADSLNSKQIKSKNKNESSVIEKSSGENSYYISLNLPEDTFIDPSTNFVYGGGNSLMAIHFIDQLELNLGIKLTPLIHSVFYSSCAETLSRLKELVYKHEQKNSIHNKEDIKSEITKKELCDVSVMEDYNEKLNDDLVKKPKIHLSNNETLSSSRSFIADSLNSKQIKSKNKNESSIIGKVVPKNSTSAEKRAILKNEQQVPTKLIKMNERKEHESGLFIADQDLHSVNKSQVTCNHTKKMVDILWTFNTGKCVDASPAISLSGDDDGIVFIGSHSHRFCAISAKNGDMLWEAILGDRIESSACLSLCHKYIIVGCYDAYVYTLEVSTGEIYWKFKTGDVVKCSPAVDPLTSFIWVGSHDECIYCLDIKSKSNEIKKNLQTGSIFSSPSISTNPHQVYISTLGGYLYSLNPFNGNTKWKRDFGKPLFTSPCITSNGVVVGCVDGGLYALNHDGNQIWKLNTGGQIFSSPISLLNNQDKEMIVCGSFSQFIFCCLINGNVKWKTNVHSKIYASPCSNSTLHSTFQKSILKDEYKTEFPSDENESQNKFDNRLFIAVCSTDGNLQMLCAECGFVFTNYKLPDEVFSSPILCGKKIFLGCRDDRIYCLKFDDI